MFGQLVSFNLLLFMVVSSYEAIRKLPREFFADPKNIGTVPVFLNKKLHKCSTFQDCIDLYDSLNFQVISIVIVFIFLRTKQNSTNVVEFENVKHSDQVKIFIIIISLCGIMKRIKLH